MSIISGNSITLVAADIFNIQSGIVIRDISAPSTDTFDTANNFALRYMGGLDPIFNGSSFTFMVYNTSPIDSITINPGTGMTFNPVNPLVNDTIPPNHSRRYYFVQTAAVLGVSASLAIYPIT
jgi:hypothetical protein